MKERTKLDRTVRDQFERLENPRIPSAKLHVHPDRYKLKLGSVGYRLVYEVCDSEVLVLVVAVGRRERDAVYLAAMKR
ncbi:type II toxin-antitoxin system RelE family toxin [Burkholderia aenigmatica]|uniref:Addiction module antitoxin n=1 Tax=Burkholderia aenigmatica TaxID=2015348 RepID=A0A228ING0_9BURK|nr:type II toxin-antitoxin system RelE/ParE family toxin [Burkholderia aenigmatica]MDN7876777.1 type II toxin-antitoxin system RelE/ParE family toxin [Burkholderia aenigmatica]OXI43719.1 addiction module antitoxin [Burkholderia aenigmatica]